MIKDWGYLSCLNSVIGSLISNKARSTRVDLLKTKIESDISEVYRRLKREKQQQGHEHSALVGNKYFARFFDCGDWRFKEFDFLNSKHKKPLESGLLFDYFSRIENPSFVVVIDKKNLDDIIWRDSNCSIYQVRRNKEGQDQLHRFIQNDIKRDLSFKLVFYIFHYLFHNFPEKVNSSGRLRIPLSLLIQENKNNGYDRNEFVNQLKEVRAYMKKHMMNYITPFSCHSGIDNSFKAKLTKNENLELDVTLPLGILFLVNP